MKDSKENRRLKAARVLAGFTQRQIGKQLGIPELEVSRIETGRVAPDAERKKQIAAILERKTFELFDS